MARGFEKPPWWAVVVVGMGLVWLIVGLPYALNRGGEPLTKAEINRMSAAASAAEASEEAERPRRVAFLGDSYTSGGNTFGEAENGWPRIVAEEFGWQPLGDERGLFGSGGTGYVNPGPGPGNQSFGQRIDDVIASRPDIVIAAGGINDAEYYPTEEIAAAASDVLNRLRGGLPDAMIVVVGPFYPREAPPEWVAARDVIFAAAGAIGAPTIDPLPWFVGDGAVEISDDGTHPTDEGHAQIAEHMAEEFRRLNLPASP